MSAEVLLLALYAIVSAGVVRLLFAWRFGIKLGSRVFWKAHLGAILLFAATIGVAMLLGYGGELHPSGGDAAMVAFLLMMGPSGFALLLGTPVILLLDWFFWLRRRKSLRRQRA